MNLLDIPKLFILSLPVAYVAWAISREELTRGFRDGRLMRWIGKRGAVGFRIFYFARCGFCQSPWIALGLCWLLDYRLFGDGFLSLILTALAVAWLSAWLQAVLASKL